MYCNDFLEISLDMYNAKKNKYLELYGKALSCRYLTHASHMDNSVPRNFKATSR